MLAYLGTGERIYGKKPVHVYERPYWEFQAVISGQIGLLTANEGVTLQRRTLWILPAGFPHGWTGRGNEKAEVAVFHFLSVPEAVRRLAEGRGYLEIPLKSEDCERLCTLSEKALCYWQQPALGMTLCHEHALLELSLLALESVPWQHSSREQDRERVDRALAWFARHMSRNPSQTEVARAVGVSPAHLRRLFHDVLETAPKQMLDQLRFQRAIQLMSAPGMKLEAVGETCGFGSASSFSRAFKNRFGCSPDAWRGSGSAVRSKMR